MAERDPLRIDKILGRPATILKAIRSSGVGSATSRPKSLRLELV